MLFGYSKFSGHNFLRLLVITVSVLLVLFNLSIILFQPASNRPVKFFLVWVISALQLPKGPQSMSMKFNILLKFTIKNISYFWYAATILIVEKYVKPHFYKLNLYNLKWFFELVLYTWNIEHTFVQKPRYHILEHKLWLHEREFYLLENKLSQLLLPPDYSPS